MIDYTIFYKEELPVADPWTQQWDLFLSAYNVSDRVRNVFTHAPAVEKHWIVHPEYEFSAAELPGASKVVVPPPGDEAEFLAYYFDNAGIDFSSARICVDITGWMRPHLMLLLQFLQHRGARVFDVVYSEPGQYLKQEKTSFSVLPVLNVRPILGFEGSHSPDTSNDLLIIGSGYDHPLIAHAAEHKRSARKIQLFGLPSLRPDMYQENVLKARWAEEAIGGRAGHGLRDFFAPANDPFVVASTLQEIVNHENTKKSITNLYLCPLATKPQALGFALYHLYERVHTSTSMIFPFPKSYARETSIGLSRIWKYTVELSAPAVRTP